VSLTKRLFIAVELVPDEQFKALYNELKSHTTKLDKINWVVFDLLHITLKFLGEVPEEKIPAIAEKLRIVCENTAPFTIDIASIGLFGSVYKPRVLWFGVENTEELQQLHRSIEKQLRKLDFPPHIGNFVPHLTIARLNKVDDKKRFLKRIEENQTGEIQRFTVKEVVLFETRFDRGGVGYERIERCELFFCP
jgi:2'-5' RNA ligase